MASEIRVNQIQNRSGLTTTTFTNSGVDVVGVATAFNFKTGTSNLHNVGIEIAGINVLGADTPIGTGSTIYDDGGARFSGVVTATSFSGSGANLTSLPAGNLTGALPAISGANLTGVGASFGNSSINTSGIITATSFHGNGANLTGIGATGTIIQTIRKSLASNFSTSSTSFQDVTGLTQAITLSNANNKVIVTACLSMVGYGDRDRRPVTALFHTNTSSSNQFTEMYAGEYHTGDSGSYSYGGHTHHIIDTPGSTSRTYKIGFKGLDGSNVRLYGKTGNVDMSYIVLQEISQ